jgi:hypothetical protein
MSNYFIDNNIKEDDEITIRFVKQELVKNLNKLKLIPYHHKSYRITTSENQETDLF